MEFAGNIELSEMKHWYLHQCGDLPVDARPADDEAHTRTFPAENSESTPGLPPANIAKALGRQRATIVTAAVDDYVSPRLNEHRYFSRGIRSSTWSPGIALAFARAHPLLEFDYCSAVSDDGYFRRFMTPQIIREYLRGDGPAEPDGKPEEDPTVKASMGVGGADIFPNGAPRDRGEHLINRIPVGDNLSGPPANGPAFCLLLAISHPGDLSWQGRTTLDEACLTVPGGSRLRAIPSHYSSRDYARASFDQTPWQCNSLMALIMGERFLSKTIHGRSI